MSNCQACGGTGYIQQNDRRVPAVIRCKCQTVQLLQTALEAGWHGLTSVSGLAETSPLESMVDRDCWVTADLETMRQHVRRTTIRRWTTGYQSGKAWRFLVVTDSELMSSWLQNLVRDGETVWDPDVIGLHQSFNALASIALPPDLLIVRLGVKAAPNKAMPDVLLEAMLERQHLGKPTWVWDQVSNPLSEGHRCHSLAVAEHLRDFQRVTLGVKSVQVIKPKALTVAPSPSPPSLTVASSFTLEGEEEEPEQVSGRRDPFSQTPRKRSKW